MTAGSRFAAFGAGVLLTVAGFVGYDLIDTSAASSVSCKQSYPNIPGRVLLENDKVIVQRFTFPPGQWEGVHAHPPNQVFIHLKGGHWTSRYGDQTSSGHWPDGSVGWIGAVSLSEQHESVNSGDEPIELIWVTLKEGCKP